MSAPSATRCGPGPSSQRLSLSGRQKAAVLLISLGAERAANVLKHLGEREVESLSAEMAALWRVRPETSAAVMREVEDRLSSNDALGGGMGGPEFAREVLVQLVGTERADEIIGTVTTKPETRPFEFLRRTPPEQVSAFLKDESPQTVALVVASVHSTLAARVLAELKPELQADVAMRIATMSETNPDVIRDIEQGLRLKLANVVGQEFAAAGAPPVIPPTVRRAMPRLRTGAVACGLRGRAEQALLVTEPVVIVAADGFDVVGVGRVGRHVDELHRQPQAADSVGDRVVHLGEQRGPTVRQTFDDVEEPQRAGAVERVPRRAWRPGRAADGRRRVAATAMRRRW